MCVLARAKETVGRVGAESHDTLVVRLLDGRTNNLLFFLANQTIIACMRIQSQHRNARTTNAEILQQRVGQRVQLAQDTLFSDAARYLRYGHMVANQRHFHLRANHHHQTLASVSEHLRQVLGMTRETELVTLDVLLVDWCSHEGVHQTGFQVFAGATQGQKRGMTCFRRRMADAQRSVIGINVDEVNLARTHIFRGLNDRELHVPHLLVHKFQMLARNLLITIDYGRANLADVRVGNTLEYDFVADTVDVATRDGYDGFSTFHNALFRIVVCLFRGVCALRFYGRAR